MKKLKGWAIKQPDGNFVVVGYNSAPLFDDMNGAIRCFVPVVRTRRQCIYIFSKICVQGGYGSFTWKEWYRGGWRCVKVELEKGKVR